MHSIINSAIAFLARVAHGFGWSKPIWIIFCASPQEEIEKYRKDLSKTGVNVYQEHTESNNEKWYFIGDTTHYDTPLCEIVLNSATTDWYTDWLPAFQIDVDTSLSMAALEKIAEKYFGKQFWKWKLDIPHYGIVLAMAILGEINGIKITLGVGTNLRDIKNHRESMQKLQDS